MLTSTTGRYYAVVELIQHPPSVVLIAVEGGELVLVRQSRPGSGSRTLELPSGKLEHGESPTDAAARELRDDGFAVDYVEDRDGRRLGAVRLGDVRLIDNVPLGDRA